MKDINELIVAVEHAVCDFFAMPYESVVSKSTKRDTVRARNFAIFILHKHHKVSANSLAKRYNSSLRNIWYVCSIMEFYIKHDKKYISYYNCLMRLMKERG